MQCDTPPTCHAAKSATRRKDASCRFLSLTACISSRGQSRPLTALAGSDCTSVVVGLPPSIHRRVLFTRRDGECLQGSAGHLGPWCHLDLVRVPRAPKLLALGNAYRAIIPSHAPSRPPSQRPSSTAKLARQALYRSGLALSQTGRRACRGLSKKLTGRISDPSTHPFRLSLRSMNAPEPMPWLPSLLPNRGACQHGRRRSAVTPVHEGRVEESWEVPHPHLLTKRHLSTWHDVSRGGPCSSRCSPGPPVALPATPRIQARSSGPRPPSTPGKGSSLQPGAMDTGVPLCAASAAPSTSIIPPALSWSAPFWSSLPFILLRTWAPGRF